jgi:hypothetical protein
MAKKEYRATVKIIDDCIPRPMTIKEIAYELFRQKHLEGLKFDLLHIEEIKNLDDGRKT